MAQFFISYASQDLRKAQEICEFLSSLGACYWIASESIEPGEVYTLAIPRAIRECEVFLLLFSRFSDESEEVMKEVTLATKYKRRVVPLRLSEYQPQCLEYHLGVPQWIDWYMPTGEPRLRRLVQEFVKVSEPPSPAIPRTGPIKGVQRPANWKGCVGLVSLAVVCVAIPIGVSIFFNSEWGLFLGLLLVVALIAFLMQRRYRE